tara:strand:+ start:570 stop:734 length:165 start_codon:yes stop_codon:yes gene_type:complete
MDIFGREYYKNMLTNDLSNRSKMMKITLSRESQLSCGLLFLQSLLLESMADDDR